MVAVHGPTLVHLALDAIDHGLVHYERMAVDLSAMDPALREPGSCFVTLKRSGALRGCIGSPNAVLPLAQDVAQNAFGAAFRDSRFSPLERHERVDLTLSVSVLSVPAPMDVDSEAALLAALRPGIDGLILTEGRARALYLPSVWSQIPEPADFVGYLKRKAGLPTNHWSETMTAHRFTAAAVTLSPDGTLTGPGD